MYYLVETDEYWSIGGSSTDVKLFKKALRKSWLTHFLKNEFEKAMEDEEIELINNCEKCNVDVDDVENELTIQYVSDGIDYHRTSYNIISDEETEEIKMFKYDVKNDSEEELIKKALHNEHLYVCIADKDYVMYVIEEYEIDADEKAYENYCETCFEPGHWKCFKATEEILEEVGDYDTLLYDEDVLDDLNYMIEEDVV